MNRLSGKVVIVTGSSRGIGKAIAKQFVEEGASVVLTSRFKESLDKAIIDILPFATDPKQVFGVVCDVSKYDDVERVISASLNQFGKIDVLINNAGTAEPFAKIIDTPIEEWYAPIETNLKGTFHGCKAILPYFLKQGKGKIINLAGAGSGNAKSDNTACISGYGASKAAIKRLTYSLSDEYKKTGVDILLLNPGMVRTEILGSRNPTPELQKRIKAFLFVQDIFAQSPSIAANLAVKLASDWSDGKSGTYLSALTKLKAQWLLISFPLRKLLGKIDRTEY